MPTSPRRLTVNLDVQDGEISDVDDVDEIVERSECSNRSELVRRLLAGDPLDELLDDEESS